MFSQVFVCPWRGWVGYLWSNVLSGGGYLGYQVPSGVVGMSREVGISMGWVCAGVGTHPPDMGPEGGGGTHPHDTMGYSRPAVLTHPT